MTFIDQIKKIPIEDYAARIGYTPVKKGSRYISLKEHDSIMIDTEKNAYWQNSEFVMGRKGGAGSVIDFAMNMRGYDLNTALRELATMYGIVGNREAQVPFEKPKFEKASSEKKREKGDIELSKAAKSNTAVIKYLTEKRKIKSEIVHSFIDRGLLYQDVKRNCVFHTERFGCKRSTGEKRFAVDLKGNDYDECFLVKPTHPSKLNNTLIVTEAVIDSMSVMSFLADKRDYQGYWYLALTGTNKTQAIFNALERNPNLQTVVLCMDNDEAGRKATEDVSARLKELGVRCIDYPAKEGKDWNEYIQILSERESPEHEPEKTEASDFFKRFPADRYDDAAALQDKTGWEIANTASGIYVYRSMADLPEKIAAEVEKSLREQAPKIDVNEKIEAFQDDLVRDIARYYITRGGDPAAITEAPDNVSVETISAVTDSIIRQDITAEQAVGVYDAMSYLEDWNASNYQQQSQSGAKAEYVFDESYMDEMANSLCSFAKAGKNAEYLMQVVQDSISIEEEQFLAAAELLNTVEPEVVQTVVEQQQKEQAQEPAPKPEIPQRDYSQTIEIALESTNDYHDENFKITNGQHLYRWMCLTADGLAIEPLDDQVYTDPADARMMKHAHPTLKEVLYDDLCDKAYYNREYGIKEKQKAQEELVQAVKEKDAEIKQLTEQLKTSEAELKQEQEAEPLSVVSAWSNTVAKQVQQMFPDSVREYHVSSGKLSEPMSAEEIEACPENALLAIESDKWNRYVESKMHGIDYTHTPPVVICEFSESNFFEENKEYSLSEFSDLMGEKDKAHHEGHKKGLAHYGNDFTAFLNAAEDPNAPYAEYASPYMKTWYIVRVPGVGEFRDRQDIGDGLGSTMDVLRKMSSFKPLMPMLDKVYEKQKSEIERKEPNRMERRIAKTTPESPKWYQQVNYLRENHSMNDIVIELAERSGKDTGRDPFEESPLSSANANLLTVAAAAEFSPEALQALSDTAKDGTATIAFKDDDGNHYPIDVKVKYIDMAKQYASDMEPLPEAPEKQNEAEQSQAAEPIQEKESPSEPEAVVIQSYSYSDIHVISYRMESLAETFEKLPPDEYEAAKNKYKDLSELYQKLTADVKQQSVVLTESEQQLFDESKKWLNDKIASMDSADRVKYELSEGIKSVLSSEEYKNWLDTTSKFFANQYSFTNAILVYLQKRDASITMPYDKWKEYGKQVMKGEEGIRIKAPKMAYEATKGQLYRSIKKGLMSRLADNPNEIAKFQLGISKLTFTMNPSNHVVGLQVNGKDKMIFASDDHLKQFIDRQILGKEPVGYKAVSVFDVSQTEEPEQLWIKESKLLPDEKPVLDENGEIQKNKRGEVLVYNSEQRKARFQTDFPRVIQAENREPLSPEKVAVLLEAMKSVNARHNVPVYERKVDEDPELANAYGYFTRKDNSIVLREDLSPEEKLKVLFHETAHADLHGDLAKLAEEMELDKKELGTNIREIQAESVAYALGKQYGIETEQDSFSYLAAYTKGFELQDLQRSMSVIKKEITLLVDDLQAELEERGYDRNVNKITEKTYSPDEIGTMCAGFVEIATSQFSKAEADAAEMPDLEARCQGSKEAMEMLADCSGNAEYRMNEATKALAACKVLSSTDSLSEQKAQIQIIRKSLERIGDYNEKYQSTVEAALDMQRAEAPKNLRKEYMRDPASVVKKLAERYPQVAKLSEVQQSYIASSKYLRKQSRMLNTDPEKFVKLACERAEQLPKIAAKNGSFIEIVSCEKWTKQKVFEDGTLCHPKYAERTIQNAEPLLENLIERERQNDRFLPTTQVVLSAYAVMDGKLKGVGTTIDIGDGEQKGMLDHFDQIVDAKKLHREEMKAFNAEIQKGGTEVAKYAEKAFIPQQETAQPEKVNTVNSLEMTAAEWQETIEQGRESAANAPAKETSDKDKENSGKDSPELG